jgi:O-antigen/teichoic acid export membrane protein
LAEKRIHINAVYNLLLSISQVVVPLLVFPYVSRVLGPEGIGQIGFIDGVVQMITLVAALGIPIYGVREIAKVKEDFHARSDLFSSLFWIHLGVSFGVALIYAGLILVVPSFQEVSTLAWISMGMILNQVLMMEWLFQGLQEFPYITKRSLLIRLLSVVLIFWLVQKSTDTWVYFVIMMGTGFLNAVFNLFYARRFVRLIFQWPQWKLHLKPLLYIFSFGLVVSVYTVLDTVLLGFWTNDQAVGYYTTSVRVIKLSLTLLTAFVVVTIPSLSVAFQEKNEDFIHGLLKKSFAFVVLIGLPASVGLMVYAPEIIQLFAGKGFEPAVLSLQILAPNIVIIGFSQLFGMQILNPSGKEKLFLKAAICGMVLSLLFNNLFIPYWGHLGASWTNLLVESVVLLLLYFMATRQVTYRPDWILLGKAFLTCLTFIPLNLWLNHMDFSVSIRLLLGVTMSIMLFFGIQHFLWKEPYLQDLMRVIRDKFQRK